MNRLIVLGASGFFGGLIVQELRRDGFAPLTASRRTGCDLRVDAEDPLALRELLRPGDVVIDAAGPFQARTTALIEAAIERGFEVVDISEDLAYLGRVGRLAAPIAAAGIRVLHGCSAISTIVATLVKGSVLTNVTGVRVLLAPASRHTASESTLSAVLTQLGKPIRTWREGGWRVAEAWSQRRRFEAVHAQGYLVESALSLSLPQIWPSLQVVDLWVATNVGGADRLLAFAARFSATAAVARASLPLAVALARRLGSARGRLVVEIEGGSGARVTYDLAADRGSYLIAVAPAVLAAEAIAEGRFEARGLVSAEQQVTADALIERLRRRGVRVERSP